MASFEREILVLFVSFLIGSVAGWWSRIYWESSLAVVAATLAGTVAGYCIITVAPGPRVIPSRSRHGRGTPPAGTRG